MWPFNKATQKPERWPVDLVQCPGQQVFKTEHMTVDDYDEVVASVHGLYAKLPSECHALPAYCPQGDWAGCVVRLAAHDFMDFKGGMGGADGCIDFSDLDNNGLNECFNDGLYGVALVDSYVHFCDRISLADFLVIAAEAMINKTRSNALAVNVHRGGIDLRSKFKYGRVTSTTCAFSYGRLPDAEKDCEDVDNVLVQNLGLTLNQSAALLGAHTIGQASLNRSGYSGFWVGANSSRKFDNEYYISLLMKGWGPKQVLMNRYRHQWDRVDVGVDSSLYGPEMMLNSDICLYYRGGAQKITEEFTKFAKCECAWTRYSTANLQEHAGAFMKNDYELCGMGQLYDAEDPNGTIKGYKPELALNFTKQRVLCCGMQKRPPYEEADGSWYAYDVTDPIIDCNSDAPAREAVIEFANDEAAWLRTFVQAWEIAVTKGYSKDLKRLSMERVS